MNKRFNRVYTRQVYFSGEEALLAVDIAEEIMQREKWSFNRLVLEAIKEYIKRHGKGNVSYQLDKYGVEWTKALPVDRGKITLNHLKGYSSTEIKELLTGSEKEAAVFRCALKTVSDAPAPKQKCKLFSSCERPVASIVVSQKGSEYAVCEYHRQHCLESGKWKDRRG